MTLGETTPSIVKRIIGSSGAKGTDGITQMTRNQVEAVTRTAVQHVANSAKEEFLKLNSDVIGEDDIYISVLDSRTTPGCKALDHKTFKRNTGPRPPLHFRCRGIRLAVLDAGLLGDRPANPTTRKNTAFGICKRKQFRNYCKAGRLAVWYENKVRQVAKGAYS